MSRTHLNLIKQYESAKTQLERVMVIPEEDPYPVGTAIRWKSANKHWEVTIKKNATYWSSGIGRADMDWSSVVNNLRMCEEWHVSTGWTDGATKAVEPLPDIRKVDGKYILTDTDSGMSWKRVGDEWVKQSTNEW